MLITAEEMNASALEAVSPRAAAVIMDLLIVALEVVGAVPVIVAVLAQADLDAGRQDREPKQNLALVFASETTADSMTIAKDRRSLPRQENSHVAVQANETDPKVPVAGWLSDFPASTGYDLFLIALENERPWMRLVDLLRQSEMTKHPTAGWRNHLGGSIYSHPYFHLARLYFPQKR